MKLFFSLFLFSFSILGADENCQGDLIDKLIDKGFMNKEVCYDFSPSENKLKVIINGMIYNMGAFDLDENRKQPDERFVKEAGNCKLTETEKYTTNTATPEPSEKNNISKAKAALELIAKLMDSLAPAVPSGKNITLSGNGYADGVNNTMSEFDNFDECLKNESYQKALKAYSTGTNWQIVSEVRNKELARYRAEQHVDYIIKKVSSTNQSLVKKDTVLGLTSKDLQGPERYHGWCDMRRGATLEAQIPGLEKKYQAEMPAEVEIQFTGAKSGDYSFMETGSGFKDDWRKRMAKKMYDLDCLPTCPAKDYPAINVVSSTVPKYISKCIDPNFTEKDQIKYWEIRQCIGKALGFTSVDLNEKLLKDYYDFDEMASKMKGKKSYTIQDVSTYLIVRAHDNLVNRTHISYVQDASDSSPHNVEEKFAKWIKNLTDVYAGKDFFEVCSKTVASTSNKNWRNFCSIFKPITGKVTTVTYDPWKIKEIKRYEQMRGFFHTACSSGVAIPKDSTQFGLRTFHIVRAYTQRHLTAPSKGDENSSLNNQFISEMYNAYDDTIMNKLEPLQTYTLQHPTMYVIAGCANCDCIRNATLDGPGFTSLLKSATRVNYTTGFSKSASGTPIKVVTGIDTMTGKKDSCLFMPPVFAAHTAGDGTGEVTIEEYDPPVISSSCNELIKQINSIDTGKTAPSATDKEEIKTHCASFISKFPYTTDACKSNCSPSPQTYKVDEFKKMLKGEKAQTCN